MLEFPGKAAVNHLIQQNLWIHVIIRNYSNYSGLWSCSPFVCGAYNGRISKKKIENFRNFSKKISSNFFQTVTSYYELFTAIRRYSSALPVRFPGVVRLCAMRITDEFRKKKIENFRNFQKKISSNFFSNSCQLATMNYSQLSGDTVQRYRCDFLA